MNDIICKYLTDTEVTWPLFVDPCWQTVNIFVNPITGYSPFELDVLRKPPDIAKWTLILIQMVFL